jgi:protein dpy-30
MSSGEQPEATSRERLNALPVRTYLDETCVPLIMQAMSAVARERPQDPIDYIAHYLLAHNPRRSMDGMSPVRR